MMPMLAPSPRPRPTPVRVEPGMRTIPLPADAPFAIGERVLVEAANGDRIVGVIAPGPTVELTAKLGPDAWRARVVRAPAW